jgi:hypothetical protein
MLTYLFIVFVIAIALAPLAHFLPSKRTREVSRMREYAALHGLFVEFRNMPAAGGVPVSAPGVIYYGKRLPNMRANPIDSGCWLRAPEGWRSVGRRLPVPAPVEELSGEIIAASVDQSSCGVYWTESSGEAEVERIVQILERWCEVLIR